MQIDIITTFPGMFTDFMRESMMARALEQGVLSINVHDLRDFTEDPHRSVDDTPFGGGGGMILMADPIARAIEAIQGDDDATLIIPAARGELFHQGVANSLTEHHRLIFVCGHYTAIDERIFEYFKPLRLCIGDYVLTGGELPTMVIVDAVARRLPGFLGNDDSGRDDSFVIDGLGAPHYTRPQIWRDLEVPSVLVSGHHANVRAWRRQQAQQTTEQFRPELLSTEADDIHGGRNTAPTSEKHAAVRSHEKAPRKENNHG